jgi:hypothetical protein
MIASCWLADRWDEDFWMAENVRWMAGKLVGWRDRGWYKCTFLANPPNWGFSCTSSLEVGFIRETPLLGGFRLGLGIYVCTVR